MDIQRFRETYVGVTEDCDGEYCLWIDYYLLKKEYDQLKKEHSLALDKLHEYRHMVKALSTPISSSP